jgi:hypothetical protein
MSVSLAHSGLPKGIGKPGLLSILDGLGRKHLALPPTAFHLLRHFVLRAKAEDFSAGRLCGNWERVEDLATILQVTPRAINLAVQKLEEGGYIQRTTAANGARGASRVGDQLKWLRGISLKPLIEQIDRLKDKHEARQFEQEAVRSLRSAISSLRRQIRQSGDMDALSRSEALLPSGRVSLLDDLEQLEHLAAAFGALVAELEAGPRSAKFSGRSEQNTRSHIQSKESQNRIRASDPLDDLRPETAASFASCDYRMILEGLGKASWPNLIEASATARAWHGISQSAWGRACLSLGRERASLAVLAIDRSARLPVEHRYRARKPAACFHGLVAQMARRPVNLLGLMLGSGSGPETLPPLPDELSAASTLAGPLASILCNLSPHA